MSQKDETIKLMAETIQNGLTKFVGESNSKNTADAVKETMTRILESFNNVMSKNRPLPTIKVETEGTVAHIKLFDPKTGKEITVADWISSDYYSED